MEGITMEEYIHYYNEERINAKRKGLTPPTIQVSNLIYDNLIF